MAAGDPIGAGRQRSLCCADGGRSDLVAPSDVPLDKDQDIDDPGIPDSYRLINRIDPG